MGERRVSAGQTTGGRVTVYGPDMLRPPLCDDASAQMVVVRNVAGEPIVLLVRLTGDTWGLSTPDDKDWPEMCVRFGLMRPRPAADVLASARAVQGSH